MDTLIEMISIKFNKKYKKESKMLRHFRQNLFFSCFYILFFYFHIYRFV